MIDSDSNDIYKSYIIKAITDIRSNNKRSDEKAIADYVIKNVPTNIDESLIESIIQKLADQNVLENKPSCKGNSFFIVAKKNSEDRVNTEVVTSETHMPQIPELCDTPQIRKDKNSIGETYTKHKVIALTSLTTGFMALKTFLIDELHSANKNINLIKNNMSNGQILDEVKHLRDDNNSKNNIIKFLTENISDITKSFSHKPNQEKPFISPKKHAKNINKDAATDKNIVPLVNRFSNLIFDYTCDLETGTNKKNETHQNSVNVMNIEYIGGKVVYVKEGLIVNMIKEFETNKSETICLELTISNKKWFIMYAYRPPNETNKKVVFDELNETLDKAVNKYDNIFLAGDLNIDTRDKSKDTNNYLSDFMDTFSLNNLIKVKTCYKSATGTIVDIMLTNKMRSF